jgi:serine phosphatase RsbU (regulator of sigma subunit)
MLEDRIEVERSIWNARPAWVIQAGRAATDAWLGTDGSEVLLLDYHQSHLVPFGDGTGGTPVPVDSHPAGRAFASGQAQADGDHLYLPLAVYGERLGTFSVRLPAGEETSAEELAEDLAEDLEAVAATLARAIRLANMATDVYRMVQRSKRLTIAAELQWDLLPGRTCASDEFSLAGQLEPAYTVSGDNFDWSISEQSLTLSVSNGMGSGINAALLTQLAVNSLRNARRSGAGPAEAAELASEIVYSQHGGASHSATLLLRINLATGEAEVVDAGSPRMLRIRRGGIEPVAFDEQLPLGMFSDSRYRIQRLTLQPGDRLMILSDGLYDARNPAGNVYGEAPLSAALRSSRLQDPNEAVRYLVNDLLAYHEGTDLQDDAIAVCLDWIGSGERVDPARPADVAATARSGGTSLDVMT